MNRRKFARDQGLGVSAILSSQGLNSTASVVTVLPAAPRVPRELNADVVIVGGSTGGCAAALAAVRNGRRVIMLEETDWIGGQLTAQAVPPDERPWIEYFGATRAYCDYRGRARDYYRRNYPLTAQARARWNLNAGNGSVSPLCC